MQGTSLSAFSALALLLALLTLACGVILDATTRGRLEMRRLAYLNWRAP